MQKLNRDMLNGDKDLTSKFVLVISSVANALGLPEAWFEVMVDDLLNPVYWDLTCKLRGVTAQARLVAGPDGMSVSYELGSIPYPTEDEIVFDTYGDRKLVFNPILGYVREYVVGERGCSLYEEIGSLRASSPQVAARLGIFLAQREVARYATGYRPGEYSDVLLEVPMRHWDADAPSKEIEAAKNFTAKVVVDHAGTMFSIEVLDKEKHVVGDAWVEFGDRGPALRIRGRDEMVASGYINGEKIDLTIERESESLGTITPA